jgi:N-acetylmuramoyl-L-alanine amidase
MEYKVSLIPKSRRQRPGYPLKPTSLTVHNTANPDADALDHAKFLSSSDRPASWHITVDDRYAVLHIPLNEQAWHTGTHAGNTTSIGIEVCEFTDEARHKTAELNAAQLIADILTGRAPKEFLPATKLSLDDVRTHQSWKQYGTTGKYCPRKILPHWDEFVKAIERRMHGADAHAAPASTKASTEPMLRFGSKGDAVKKLQTLLNKHGVKGRNGRSLVVDGIFGSNTLTAVRRFQYRAGLVVDGIVGPKTWAALKK